MMMVVYILLFYGDNMIVACNSMHRISTVKFELVREFDMKDLRVVS